jgi:hypothetical protein
VSHQELGVDRIGAIRATPKGRMQVRLTGQSRWRNVRYYQGQGSAMVITVNGQDEFLSSAVAAMVHREATR